MGVYMSLHIDIGMAIWHVLISEMHSEWYFWINWLLLIVIGKVLQKKRYSESGLFASRIGRDYGEPLVAQIVKSLLALQETWVWSLGREDPLEKGMATHSSILAWEIPRTEEPDRLHTVHEVTKSQTQLKWLSMHSRTYILITKISSMWWETILFCNHKFLGSPWKWKC